jgi:ketosteroid isomerase-like protein
MDREYTDRFLEKVGAAASDGPSDPLAILRSVYAAIIDGDFDALGKWFTDDVEFSMGGFGPFNGTWRGREDVLKATRRNYSLATNQQSEVEGMISGGPCVAVLMRENGTLKSSGQAYSIRGVHWFTFADGKIKKIDGIAASIWKAETQPGA